MKTARRIMILVAVSAGPAFAQEADPSPAPTPEPLPSAELRVRLSDVGGALSNEGFKMRDRLWSGKIKPGEARRLAVNLFRGNQYWFCAAMDPEIKSPRVTVYGPDGQPVEAVKQSEAGSAAAGVTAEVTGRYFIEIETSSGPASDFCLLYLFK